MIYTSIQTWFADDTGYNSLSSIFLAGAIAGAPAAFLVTPMDMIKTRLQVVSTFLNQIKEIGFLGVTKARGNNLCWRT